MKNVRKRDDLPNVFLYLVTFCRTRSLASPPVTFPKKELLGGGSARERSNQIQQHFAWMDENCRQAIPFPKVTDNVKNDDQ
jgi:hypothetical protein